MTLPVGPLRFFVTVRVTWLARPEASESSATTTTSAIPARPSEQPASAATTIAQGADRMIDLSGSSSVRPSALEGSREQWLWRVVDEQDRRTRSQSSADGPAEERQLGRHEFDRKFVRDRLTNLHPVTLLQPRLAQPVEVDGASGGEEPEPDLVVTRRASTRTSCASPCEHSPTQR